MDDDAWANGELAATLGASVYTTPSFRPAEPAPQISYEIAVQKQMVTPLASDRPTPDIYARWKMQDCPARAERRGLNAFVGDPEQNQSPGDKLEAWETIYQERMEANGVLPPFNKKSITYKALEEKAASSEGVRRQLVDQLNDMADAAVIDDKERYMQAAQARAKRHMESLREALDSEIQHKRSKQPGSGMNLPAAAAFVSELVDQLLRTKLGSSGDGRAWLPASSESAPVGTPFGPRIGTMHADLRNPQSRDLLGRSPTPLQDRAPSPAPGAGAQRTRVAGLVQQLEDQLDGGRGAAMRQAQAQAGGAGPSSSSGPVAGPWMVANAAGEGNPVSFPSELLPTQPSTGAGMAVFDDNKTEWQQRATSELERDDHNPEPVDLGYPDQQADGRPETARLDVPSTNQALRPTVAADAAIEAERGDNLAGPHDDPEYYRMPPTGPPNPARRPDDAHNDLWMRNDAWLYPSADSKAADRLKVVEGYLGFLPRAVGSVPEQLEKERQTKRRRSARGVAACDASNSAYESAKGWDLRTLPQSEQLAAENGDWWKVDPVDGSQVQKTARAYELMDELIEQAALAVQENRYFQQSWGIDELLELERHLPEKYENPNAVGAARYSNRWTDFKDTYMAKFFIHTNLMCLEAASRRTSAGARPTDFRTRMIESFDLPGLLQNVKKIWRYRKNIWRLKTRTQDPSHAGPMYDLARGCAAAQILRTAGGNLRAVPGLEASEYDEFEMDTYTPLALAQEHENFRIRGLYMQHGYGRAGHTDNLHYAPPPELPSLILAPPRMGKSALIWLMTSFGVKLGGTVFIGIAPHKKIPMDEMLGKVQGQLQWTAYSSKELQVKNRVANGSAAAAAAGPSSRAPTPTPLLVQPASAAEPATRMAPRIGEETEAARAVMSASKPRHTTQGLEVAVPWTSVPRPAGDPQIDPNSAITKNEWLWRRATVHGAHYSTTHPKGTPDVKLLPVEGVTKQMYTTGGHKQGIDKWHPHAVGTVYDMMHERSVPGETHSQTHVFLYSHAVAGDARAVEQATALLRTPDPDRWRRIAGRDVQSSVHQWTLHIRDEAQYLCQSATDSQKLSELDKDMPWIRDPALQTPEIQAAVRRGRLPPRDADVEPQEVQENEIGGRWGVGWRQPGEVLDALRSTYPVVRGLSICVSGTILPCMIETQLWGDPALPKVDAGGPAGTPLLPLNSNPMHVTEWKQWFETWDRALVEKTRKSYEPGVRLANPLLCSPLTPPRGRIADVGKLPGWVQRGDPDNVDKFNDAKGNVDPPPLGRTYYGTMEHVVQWDGGPLTLLYGDPIPPGFSRGPPVPGIGGSLVNIDAAMRGGVAPTDQGAGTYGVSGSPSVFPLLNDDVRGRSGIGKFLAFNMNKLDMAHDYESADLRAEMNTLVAAYQNDWQLRGADGNKVDYPGAGPGIAQRPGEYAKTVIARLRKNSALLAANKQVVWPERLNDHRFDYYRGRHYYRPTPNAPTLRLMPHRRIMASVLEFPSSDAVKVLTHVKEWLEQDATEVPHPDDRDQIKHVFSPMYVMCPLRRQVGDSGVADWVKHAIKFAWLRMHKDFLRAAPKRFGLARQQRRLRRVQAQHAQQPDATAVREAEAAVAEAQRAFDKHQEWRTRWLARRTSRAAVPDHTPDGDPQHPYNACQNVAEFRRKYGMVALLYASNQSEEQNMRTSLQNDMDDWALEHEMQQFRDSTVTSDVGEEKGKKATEVNKDGRLLSVLFDPALVENRLHQYGDPPDSTWTVIERRQRDLEGYLPPTEAERDDNVDGLDAQFVQPGRGRQPLEQQQANGSWVPYGTQLGAGRMVPVAHGFRLELNLQVHEGVTDQHRRGNVWLRLPRPTAHNGMPAEPRYRVQRHSQYIPDPTQSLDPVKGYPAIPNPNYATGLSGAQNYYSEFHFDPTLAADAMPRLQYRRCIDDYTNVSQTYGARPYGPDQGYLNPEATPLENLNGIVVRHRMHYWPNAQVATRYFLEHFGVHKIMIAGYGMLEAGLTIQSTDYSSPHWFRSDVARTDGKRAAAGENGEGGLDVHWVPKYMSIATAHDGAVDSHYQIIGRCFVDTRKVPLPPGWKINFLAARPIYAMIKLYALLELRLGQLENVTLTHAFAHLAQMMTHPEVVNDDGTKQAVHDVVSILLHHRLHTKNRNAGRLFQVMGLTAAPPSAFGGLGEWKRSIPQHAPSSSALVVRT